MQIALDVAINERIARGWWLKFATKGALYPAIGGMMAGMPNSPRKGARMCYLKRYPFPLVAGEWFNQSPALSGAESQRCTTAFSSMPRRACTAPCTDPQPLRSGVALGRFSLQSAHPNTRKPSAASCATNGFSCGAGGVRTRVQTGNQQAFYMLSRRLIVGGAPGERPPNIPLSARIFAQCPAPCPALSL